MALDRQAFAGVLLAAALQAAGQTHVPFPVGHSMGTLGTIVWQDGPSGRQPWVPAALLRDSLRFGVAVAGVDYYDDMDNLSSRDIRLAAVGGWHLSRFITVKASYQYFNAFDTYFEQAGYLSLGTNVLRWAGASVELSGTLAGLRGDEDERETLVELGASVWVPRRYAALSLSVAHLTVEDASEPGFSSDPVVRIGLHTRRQRFGALGVTCEVVAADDPYVRFSVGQEVWLHRVFGLAAAVSTDPFMIGVGTTFVFRRYGANVSLVHHPVLGWSRGFMLEYAQPRRPAQAAR